MDWKCGQCIWKGWCGMRRKGQGLGWQHAGARWVKTRPAVTLPLPHSISFHNPSLKLKESVSHTWMSEVSLCSPSSSVQGSTLMSPCVCTTASSSKKCMIEVLHVHKQTEA
jgi:hypothetical protein